MTDHPREWAVIFESADPLKAHLVQTLLQEEGIPAVVLNQRDSAFGFGTARVMVPAPLHKKARVILEKSGWLPPRQAEG